MDLLILCCFGGVPFIQFPSSPKQQLPYDKIRHQWDPTDWVAIDVTDSLLYDTTNNNSSSIPSLNPLLKKLLPSDIPTTNIDKCDLWNLTFASGADKHLFRKSHGKLKCRCPLEFIGIACQQQKIKNKTTPFPSINLNLTKQKFKKMALIGTTTSTFSLQQGNSFIWFLLVFMVLALIMVTLFMMFRGCCFCDCFGGIPNNRRYDQPINSQTINRCMEAVRAHENEEKAKYSANGDWSIAPPPPQSIMVIDSRRPLLPQTTNNLNSIPSISENIPSIVPRSCSPPPSYRSSNGSIDKINK